MDLREISDRLEIRELMDRYAMACDSKNWDAYRTIYAPDAIIDYTEFGGGRGGIDTTLEWLSAGLGPFAGLHHNLTTHYCEIDGDTAKAITYWLAYQTLPDGSGGEFIMECGGYYKDRLVRTDRWLISERVDVGTWVRAPFPEGFTPPSWYGTMNHHLPTLLEG
ncbi:MAG: nuclear transport factor 2 family protein [Acidimicrobiia bacterium]